jgi:hypothetical protein
VTRWFEVPDAVVRMPWWEQWLIILAFVAAFCAFGVIVKRRNDRKMERKRMEGR